MVNINALKGEIITNGFTIASFKNEIGMSESTWRRRREKKVFGSDEIEKMIPLLKITTLEKLMNIFFTDCVT